ncbi:MAG TPA: PVC-type heme-binding CxxCH protein [Verrucomicrobiae bacterium]|nr:PVC-type heme-binding CxxCH protein [Verrucomicrobiae bacterium]
MKRIALACCIAVPALPALAAGYKPDHAKSLGFPIYSNASAGKQLSGVYKATETPPLAPEESQKKINVPPGFEVRLFASEPEVVNPVAMTWDERGRLWVLELYEYPKGSKKGEKGRDRIKILEDTDADGKADKVSVFADGFSLATGLALGNGGVYLGVAPDLLFLEDTNGDDKADKTTVLKTGFGMEDRHELLNGFAWGPDGWLYMTHGVFTHSKVRDPVAASREGAGTSTAAQPSALSRDAATNQHDPDGFGVQMDAALARYHPRTKKFEVFADGTSNPWGVDWNERGDAFVSACVIHHLFHMAPGGQYNRQGGTWANPYGYVGDLPSKGLPAIVDWRHFRAAHSSICIYQGDQWPAEWRGLVFIGNIHESAINCDRLTPVGSTYRAERETKLLGPRKGDYQVGAGTFLASDDRWFRPVSTQTGPDGAVWIADWCDKYPCYQNAQADPEGVDRELGRIWRVVWVGNEKGKLVNSRRLGNPYLAGSMSLPGFLDQPNSWERRQAQLILVGIKNDPSREPEKEWLEASFLAPESKDRYRAAPELRLNFLWALHSCGLLDESCLDKCATDQQVSVRVWAARLTGERGDSGAAALARLNGLACDSDITVRAATASALRQLTSGSLTVDTPAPTLASKADLITHFGGLLSRPSVEGDFYYPHIVWMAMEPRVAADPQPFLPLVSANDNSVSAYCLRRVMRRICDLSDSAARTKHLNAAMEHLASIAGKTMLAEAALDGLIDAFKSKGLPPTIPLESIFQKLTANPALADKARRLATLLGDVSASRVLIAKINDAKASLEERLKGITAARETKDDVARAELLNVLKSPVAAPRESAANSNAGDQRRSYEAPLQTLYVEALRALGAFGGDDIAYAVTDAWKNFSLPTRRVASEVLVLRSKWSRALLAAVDQKTAKPEDISASARRALARSEDATVRDNADRLLGKYRPPGEDKLKLIAEKRKVVLAGEPDLTNGHEVAKRTCFVCHKLHGEGADVGPDLTGVGRSTLDALLHNVIDPNEVVGNGNEATEVELKDGTSLTGRIVEDSPSRLKLLASGPIEHVLAKSDIAVENGKPKIRTSQLSLMPEGLEVLPDKDFRDMIWFLLNPPQDQRPWTKELRKELVGE